MIDELMNLKPDEIRVLLSNYAEFRYMKYYLADSTASDIVMTIDELVSDVLNDYEKELFELRYVNMYKLGKISGILGKSTASLSKEYASIDRKLSESTACREEVEAV